MANPSAQLRILFITPQPSFIPASADKKSAFVCPRARACGHFPAELICDLLRSGVDVHVAQPDYRRVFANLTRTCAYKKAKKIPTDRLYLAEDRVFFYSNHFEVNYEWENMKISLAFQREIVNHILPLVQPDVIHCHDWMSGLIPAVARALDVPCVFTVQNNSSAKTLLSCVEDMGIDAAPFWQYLFYDRFPANYEETRETNPINLLMSGVFAAHFVSTYNSTLTAKTTFAQTLSYKNWMRGVMEKKWHTECVATNINDSLRAQDYIDIYKNIAERKVIINTKKHVEYAKPMVFSPAV